MKDGMVTLGCIMAEVLEHDSGEITSASAGDVRLSFCHTTESETETLIVTPQMRELGEVGFLPIAIARIDLNCPGQIFLFALDGLSEELRHALEHQGCDLVRGAFGCLAGGQDVPAVSD